MTRSTKKNFDPRVLVFACNWCSYAGADTAGVGRLPQTPHFRLLRVMCSGRVHPAFVLRAFARGADGVMVSGCHFGDCHYIFGNYRAVEQHEKTKALVDMLGLEPERLRLEWISAAEGIRFAEVMNGFVEDIRAAGPTPLGLPRSQPEPDDAPPTLETAGALSCLECGRCTGVCPVAKHQPFSPRRLISQTVAGGIEALADEPSLWTCLTCGQCSLVCPVQIDYPNFVLQARASAVASFGARSSVPEPPTNKEASETEPKPEGVVPCSHGGVFEQVSLMHARPGLRQRRLGWLTDDLKVRVVEEGKKPRDGVEDLLYIGCSPYFAAYFGGETGEGLTESMRSVVRLLNRVDITPALLANERCCGYHLRLAGRVAEAEALEKLLVAQIQKCGPKRVVAFCPECLTALGDIFRRHRVAIPLVHLSELLRADPGALRPKGTGNGVPVTYQDPCRLGRGAGLYDPPRRLLTESAAWSLAEMPHSRERAICCGNTAWLNCNAGTKRFQNARLAEAAATGSSKLVTACPGCYIHLRCAQEGSDGGSGASIEIIDLWHLLDRSLVGPPAKSPARRKAGRAKKEG